MEQKIEKEIDEVKKHNDRIEAEREWESSLTRVFTICMVTYVATATMFATIGVKEYFLNALIPTTAFFVSTLSLPPLKRWWIRRYISDIKEK